MTADEGTYYKNYGGYTTISITPNKDVPTESSVSISIEFDPNVFTDGDMDIDEAYVTVNNVAQAYTIAKSAGPIVKITDISYTDGSGNKKIPTGQVIQIKNLRAKVRPTPAASTGNIVAKVHIGNTAAAEEQFMQATVTINVDTTFDGMRGNFYSLSRALMTQERDAHISEPATISFYWENGSGSDLVKGSSGDTSGHINLDFATNSVNIPALTTNAGSYYAEIRDMSVGAGHNVYFTEAVTVDTNVLRIRPPHNTDLAQSKVYHITVSAIGDGVKEGFTVAAAKSGMVLLAYDPAVWAQGHHKHAAGYYMSTAFSELTVENVSTNKNDDSFIFVTLKQNGALQGSSNPNEQQQIVIEFPNNSNYDSTATASLIDPVGGLTGTTGKETPCAVYIASNTLTSHQCFGYQGATATTPRKIDLNHMVVVTLAAGDIATTNVVRVAVKIKNPNAIAVQDVGIHTRVRNPGDVYEVVNSQWIRAFCNTIDATAATLAENWFTVSDTKVGVSTSTWTFSFDVAANVPTAGGWVVFVYDTARYEYGNTSASVTAPTSTHIIHIRDAGWIAINPDSTINAGSATTFTLTNMRNIDRREPSATYPASGWTTSGNIMQRKFTFNQGTPVAWIPNLLTSYTIQENGTGSALAFTANWSKWAKVDFTITNALPATGWAIRIEWPSEFPDQNFCPCWAYDITASVDYACDCTTENRVWAITPQTAIGVNAANAIRVIGYVKGPASASTSQEIEITTYDGAMANDFRIDRDETTVTIVTQSVDAAAGRPAQLTVPTQFKTKQPTWRKLVRAAELAPFTFNFMPHATTANLVYEVNLTNISTAGTPAVANCRVMFYDRAANTRHGSICDGAARPVFNIYWPANFALLTTKVYEVSIYTVGLQTHTAHDGHTFPADTVVNQEIILNYPITASTPTHTTSANYQTAMKVEATSKWKFQNLSSAVGLSAWPKVIF